MAAESMQDTLARVIAIRRNVDLAGRALRVGKVSAAETYVEIALRDLDQAIAKVRAAVSAPAETPAANGHG